jgi:cytidyltransferase-like protein
MFHAYQKPLCGKSVGVVFGSFAPLHQGHLDLIMKAKKENDGVLVICCGYDGDKGEPLMQHKKRYRYVREFFADDDLVAVYAINDTEIGAQAYPCGWKVWMEEFNRIWKKAVLPPCLWSGCWKLPRSLWKPIR